MKLRSWPAALLLACTLSSPVIAKAFPAILELASLMPENGGDGRDGYVIRSTLPGRAGHFLDAAILGDLNADGIADLALGTPGIQHPGQTSGAGFVVFGRRDNAARFGLDTLDGSNGFMLDLGTSPPSEVFLGSKIADVGDFDGDGASDVAIAASYTVFVVFGHGTEATGFPARVDLGALDGNNGLGIDMRSRPGSGAAINALAAAGDLDGDGLGDLVAGNSVWQSEVDGPTRGAVCAVFGRTDFPAHVRVAELDGGDGFRIVGNGESISLGSGGAFTHGDLNGDGRGDLVTNAGRRGMVLFDMSSPFPASRDLPALVGTTGFAFFAGTDPEYGVAAGGDLNGDGWSDLAYSERVRSYSGPWVPGRSVFVVFGHAPGYPPALGPDDLDGHNGFRYLAEPDADLAGADAAIVGDVNGDGLDDLAIYSKRCCSGPALPDRDVVHVIFGRRGGFPAQSDESILDGIRGFMIVADSSNGGGRVAGGGDVNGDGIDDVLIALNHGEGSVVAPHVGDFAYVVYGRESSLFSGGFDPRP